MSDLRDTDVIAVCAGDFHAEEKAPVARSAELDWFAAMYRALKELRLLAARFGHCPIFFPGDVFNKWNAPPVLINWMIKCLPPRVYAVAGNHDLPLHNYADIEKSAYWTLYQAAKLTHLTSKPTMINSTIPMAVYGFSLGIDYTRVKALHPGRFNLAIIHDYCWKEGHSFPGSPDDKHVSQHWERLKDAGFNCAVFGDNHKGFISGAVANPGTVRCRTTDEAGYHPMVALLTRKGVFVPHYLNVAEDRWADGDVKDATDPKDMVEFMRVLGSLGDAAVNFESALTRMMKKQGVKKSVQDLVLSYLESK